MTAMEESLKVAGQPADGGPGRVAGRVAIVTGAGRPTAGRA